MQTFDYMDTLGKKQSVQATDANSAIASATNRAPNSGVQQTLGEALQTNEPAINTTQPTATPPAPIFQAPTPTDGDKQFQDIDEDGIRRRVLQQYQGQINASKASYSRLLGETKTTGQGRLGEGTAQQARGGLLGSDFGQAQTDKTRGFNQSEEQRVLESEAIAIANIMSQANADADRRVSAKREANRFGYEASKQFRTEETARKADNLKKLASSLLRQNITPEQLGTQLKDIANKYMVSENDIINSYLNTKEEAQVEQRKLDAQARKDNSFDLSEGGARFAFDPETGETKMIASRAKTYEPNEPESMFGGYTEDQNKKIASIDDKISKNETYKKTSNMRGYADNVIASLSQQTGTGDLAAINQFQKVIDEGAVTRDQDVKLIQASQSLLNTLNTKAKKLAKGEQLSPALRSEMKASVEALYEAQIKALAKDPFINAKKFELQRFGIDENNTIIGELGAYSTGGQQQGFSAEEQSLADQMRQDGYSDEIIEEAFGKPISFKSAGNAKASKLVSAISDQESGGDYSALNKDSGAMGRYQIMPSNLQGLLAMADTPANRRKFMNSPQLQDQAFNNLIQELDTTYKGDTRKILAAYYGGGNAAKIIGTSAGNKPQGDRGQYPSINQYVDEVMRKLS